MAKSSARKAREKQAQAGNGKGSEARPRRIPAYDPHAFAREQRFGGHRTGREIGFR